MRIAHYVDSTSLQHGGVPRFVLDVARVMAEQGHPSTVLTTETTDTPQHWLADDQIGLPRVQTLSRGKFPGATLSAQGMRDARRALANVDVLHLHCVWSLPNLQLAAAARAMGVPYVISMHGMLDDWSMAQSAMKKRAYMMLGARKMLERAAFVHSTAQAELDQSKKWFPRGNAFVSPYIVDLEPYKNLPGAQLAREKFACMSDPSVPTLLFLSRLHYKKGVEHLIRASKMLRDQGVDHRVALAGPGDEPYIQSLKKLSQDLGVSDIVSFLGMVRGDLRTSVYQAADLFVLPTSQENFGIVLLESMCCQTPVVTTKGVDIWQELATSGAGTIVENGDSLPTQLASNIKSLLADRKALRASGVKAREWGFSTYSQDALVPQFERMYTLAANSRPEVATGRFAALAAR